MLGATPVDQCCLMLSELGNLALEHAQREDRFLIQAYTTARHSKSKARPVIDLMVDAMPHGAPRTQSIHEARIADGSMGPPLDSLSFCAK